MPMLHPVRRLLLHLRKHIPDDLGILPGEIIALEPAAGPDDGDEGELRPGERVVEVVFQKVVFGEVCDVAGLDCGEEVDEGGVGGEGDDVDHFRGFWLNNSLGFLFARRDNGFERLNEGK